MIWKETGWGTIIYLAALEQGMAPDDMVSDEPIMVAGRAYPRNFDGRYHGPVKIVDALANSFNAATVRGSAARAQNPDQPSPALLRIRAPSGISTMSDM